MPHPAVVAGCVAGGIAVIVAFEVAVFRPWREERLEADWARFQTELTENIQELHRHSRDLNVFHRRRERRQKEDDNWSRLRDEELERDEAEDIEMATRESLETSQREAEDEHFERARRESLEVQSQMQKEKQELQQRCDPTPRSSDRKLHRRRDAGKNKAEDEQGEDVRLADHTSPTAGYKAEEDWSSTSSRDKGKGKAKDDDGLIWSSTTRQGKGKGKAEDEVIWDFNEDGKTSNTFETARVGRTTASTSSSPLLFEPSPDVHASQRSRRVSTPSTLGASSANWDISSPLTTEEILSYAGSDSGSDDYAGSENGSENGDDHQVSSQPPVLQPKPVEYRPENIRRQSLQSSSNFSVHSLESLRSPSRSSTLASSHVIIAPSSQGHSTPSDHGSMRDSFTSAVSPQPPQSVSSHSGLSTSPPLSPLSEISSTPWSEIDDGRQSPIEWVPVAAVSREGSPEVLGGSGTATGSGFAFGDSMRSV
ncbi:unnamed protein product [Sympodiomycopsis kandeliae]